MLEITSMSILAGEDGCFRNPAGIAYEKETGIFYVADMQNHRICAIKNGGLNALCNKIDEGLRLERPLALALSRHYGIITADAGHNKLFYKNTEDVCWKEVKVNVLYINGGSSALQLPAGVTADESGNIYTIDFFNNMIVRIDKDGNAFSIAGNGTPGIKDGPCISSQINKTFGLFYFDRKVYFADEGNNAVRYVDLDMQKVFTLQPSNELENGIYAPNAVALCPEGNIYICEKRRILYMDGVSRKTTIILDKNIWNEAAERFNIPGRICHVGSLTVLAKGDIYWADTIKGLVYHVRLAL